VKPDSTNNEPYRGVDRDGIDELLTVEEIAKLLKVPTSWIYERTRGRGAAQLLHIKLGKYLRFEERAVRDYLRRQRRGYCGSVYGA